MLRFCPSSGLFTRLAFCGRLALIPGQGLSSHLRIRQPEPASLSCPPFLCPCFLVLRISLMFCILGHHRCNIHVRAIINFTATNTHGLSLGLGSPSLSVMLSYDVVSVRRRAWTWWFWEECLICGMCGIDLQLSRHGVIGM